MSRRRTGRIFFWLTVLLLLPVEQQAVALPEGTADVGELVKRAYEYYRDEASVARIRMTIHRPDWERKQVMHIWTVGEEDSLFTIIEPARDRGNGTLKKGNEMWTYNPKVNRIIKLPPSMMSQSWMGSDFSNNDLAKADALIKDYTHELRGEEEHEGKKVFVITSTPKKGAPVIWGKEVLRIREDLVFLEEAFFDEDGNLVKTLKFQNIEMISGKLYSRILTMEPADKPGQFTRIEYLELEFRDDLPERYFTRSSLRDPPSMDL